MTFRYVFALIFCGSFLLKAYGKIYGDSDISWPWVFSPLIWLICFELICWVTTKEKVDKDDTSD